MGRADDEMVAGGGSALAEKRAAFLRLVRQVVSNSEVCPAGGGQPSDRDTVAVRAHDPEPGGDGRALSSSDPRARARRRRWGSLPQ